jgi:hypothetical protein
MKCWEIRDSRYAPLNPPACSCVSITLPAFANLNELWERLQEGALIKAIFSGKET